MSAWGLQLGLVLWLGPGQSEVVQHSLDHYRLPCLPELQHAAGSRASCKAPQGNVAVLLARLGSPRKQRSGISPPGSGPSEAGNRFLEAASCHEQVLVGPDVLEPHHADAGAAAGCAVVQERPLGRLSERGFLQGMFWASAMAV